jgi:hypothetical protein
MNSNNKINKHSCKGEQLEKLLEYGYPIKRGSLESWIKFIEGYKKDTGNDYIVPSGILIAVKVSKDDTENNYEYRLKVGNGVDDFYSLPYCDSIADDSLYEVRHINQDDVVWTETNTGYKAIVSNIELENKYISLVYDTDYAVCYVQFSEDIISKVLPNTRIDISEYTEYAIIYEPRTEEARTLPIQLEVKFYNYISDVLRQFNVEPATFESEGIANIATTESISLIESKIDNEQITDEDREQPTLINPFHLISYIKNFISNWWNDISSSKQDTLIAGTNINIASDGKTISATDTTYSVATDQISGLMSASDKSKLDGIESNAEVNVQSDWNETNSASNAFIKNKPTIPTVSVTDVQVNGASVLENGIASIPTATQGKSGVVKSWEIYGTKMYYDYLITAPASAAEIRGGVTNYKPIVSSTQNASVFYGLAKASGDTTQASANTSLYPVGTYTGDAMKAIREMLGIVVLTQAEYDLILQPDPNIIYLIKEAVSV